MMRETKIGLLVGLAFIIVIGILLSDHLTTTTEPQQAALVTAGGNVRSAVTVPGEASAARLTTAVQPARQVAPQQPVPTREELTPRKPPVEIVQIGQAPQPKVVQPQPAGQNTQVASTSNNGSPTSLSAEQGVSGVDSNSPAIGRHPAGPGSLASIAQGMGEEIVPADNSSAVSAAKPADNGAALAAGERQYTAAPGDSLSKIASKFLGNGRKANCDAIIAANPALQQNPNLIIAGQTYVIPASASSNAPGAPGARTRTAGNISTRADSIKDAAAQQPTKRPEYFYTVKPGDTLTRISLEQLGNAQGVEAIKDLNEDILSGSDIIRPNMKLRLPAKPVAIAQ